MKILVVLASLTSLILAQAPSKVCETYKDMLDGCYVHYDGNFRYEIFKDGKMLCSSAYDENGRLIRPIPGAADTCESKGLR